MLKKSSAIIILFLQTCWMLGQSGFTTMGGANFVSFGRAGVNLTGIESMYMNQAGISEIKNYALDVSVERRFNLSELNNISMAAAKTLKLGTFGIVVSNFGFSDYSEQKFGFAYARKLGKSVSLGGQFDLLKLNVSTLGSKNIYTFELGMQVKLNHDFSLGFHIFSPGNVQVAESTDLGTRLRMGVKYSPSQKVFILVEFDKVIYRSLEYKLGIAYQAAKAAQIRLGVNPSTESFSFGAFLSFKDAFKFGSAYQLNNNLGNTPAFTLQYQQ